MTSVHQEAPASANVKVTRDGFEWLVTIRDFGNPSLIQQMLDGISLASNELKNHGYMPAGYTPTEEGEMSFAAAELKPNMMDGNLYWNVTSMRGKYSKFGIRVWPEVLEAAGIDPEVVKKKDLTGWTAHLEERYAGKDEEGNEKTKLVVARLEPPTGTPAEKPTTERPSAPAPTPAPVPAPAEKSTAKPASAPAPQQPPAENSTAKPANGNGQPLPPRPWKPEDLKHILATSAGKKNISGQISDKDAQLIAGKIQAVFIGPAQENQGTQERAAEKAKAELDYHEVIGWLFQSAHGKDGSVSAKNLTAAEGQTVIGWLLAKNEGETNKWKWNPNPDSIKELLAVRDSLKQPQQQEIDF
jgi:hypothetical protein